MLTLNAVQILKNTLYKCLPIAALQFPLYKHFTDRFWILNKFLQTLM